ncbi:hypothetical protein PSCICN_31900 [Pseudomonas cichorii]|uniref:hypothetical protein n=1 Tax=Pseudomonas cichorii TaxID=36746 RepID=UPI00190FC0D6|nr:hypothetical protein [Pseudomonas cichorii]GFM82498.1 hypothetical protein PSCICN_31900 [Pseudomonas cichorii]
MKTNFQIALEKNEAPDFFNGQGQYFSRDPDWGDHLYISNWQGVCGYLKQKEQPNKILLEAFNEYLQSLRISYEDADSLLLNISCYYSMRADTSFMSADDFDLILALDSASKKIIGELFRLLRREYAAHNAGSPVISFDQFLSEIKDNGCKIDLEKL